MHRRRTGPPSADRQVRHNSEGHVIATPGRHVLESWTVDPTVRLQELVVDAVGEQPSCLGPPESRYADRGRITAR